MWYDQYYSEINSITKYASLGYSRHLTVATGGNISIRCGDGILITASGTSLCDISAEQMILVDYDGKVLCSSTDKLKPSKETKLHLELYHSYDWIKSVYHVHPPFITAFSSSGRIFPRVTSSAKNKLSPSPMVPFAPAGSQELVEHLRNTISHAKEDSTIFILEGHGTICFGNNLAECYYTTELVEECAKIAYLN